MKKKDEKDTPRLGKQPPRYRFFLNPYQDARFSKCPQCANKTGQRKLPLFIHIDPKQPLLLNKTCRYCSYCDLLIAHQNELDEIITRVFTVLDPEIVGNTYGPVDFAGQYYTITSLEGSPSQGSARTHLIMLARLAKASASGLGSLSCPHV